MKKAFIVPLVILFSTTVFSQFTIINKKDYTYGKMVGVADTLVGYFWFDNRITQNGQTVYFKESLGSGNRKRFQSRKYNYFESDSLYMETFGVISKITGDLLVMIPRVINGSIQLFQFNLDGEDNFFLKKGNYKLQMKKKEFRGLIMGLVWDDELLLSRVEKSELGYDDIKEIVTTYNNNHPVKNQ